MFLKNNIFFLLFLFLFYKPLYSQSVITDGEKMESLCKIWGFLKYYHPEVSRGKYDWDQQLVSKIPVLLKLNTEEEINDFYINWINSLGEINKSEVKEDNSKQYFDKNFNLDWISNTNFSENLVEKLKYIETHRNTKNQFYVAQKKSIGNVIIKNEDNNANIKFPQLEYKLLDLFRFWNIIEYFYPHKYLMDHSWDSVLVEAIPEFIDVQDIKSYHMLLLKLISKLDDSHSFFSSQHTNEYFGYYWVPFQFKIIDDKVVISDYYNETLAKRDGLEIGDVILQINEIPISKLLEKNFKFIPASNIAVKKRDAYFALFNGNSDNVMIELEKDGKKITKKINRYKFSEFNYKQKISSDKWHILENNIGYINLGNIKPNEVDEAMEALWNTKSIILDLRNGALDIYGIGKYFKPERSIFLKIIKPDISYPGKFVLDEEKFCCQKSKKIYLGKVVILVNENVQSHGEYTCMVLQSGKNVTTIGNQSAGADGQVSIVPFLDNLKTSFTGVAYFYPDGTQTQRTGVKIDITVNPSVAGIKDGIDEILQSAIEYLDK